MPAGFKDIQVDVKLINGEPSVVYQGSNNMIHWTVGGLDNKELATKLLQTKQQGSDVYELRRPATRTTKRPTGYILHIMNIEPGAMKTFLANALADRILNSGSKMDSFKEYYSKRRKVTENDMDQHSKNLKPKSFQSRGNVPRVDHDPKATMYGTPVKNLVKGPKELDKKYRNRKKLTEDDKEDDKKKDEKEIKDDGGRIMSLLDDNKDPNKRGRKAKLPHTRGYQVPKPNPDAVTDEEGAQALRNLKDYWKNNKGTRYKDDK